MLISSIYLSIYPYYLVAAGVAPPLPAPLRPGGLEAAYLPVRLAAIEAHHQLAVIAGPLARASAADIQ